MDVTLRQIRAFLSVAHLKSFTRAASLLHLSQPALTVQIRNLETALGAKLLDRTSRSVEITRLGQELIPALQRTLRDLETAVADIHEAGTGRRGTVRIAALPSFAGSFLPGVILRSRRENPALSFVVRDAIASRVNAMVGAEEVDLGITGGEVVDPQFEVLQVVPDRLCLICPQGHPLARKRRVTVAEVADLPLVLTNPGTSVREVVDAAFLAIGRIPNLACEVTYMMSAVAMVRAGLGFSVLPSSAREVKLERGLRARPIEDPAFSRPASIIKKKGRTLPPASAAFLERCLAELPKSFPEVGGT
jgi:DNA-binding transcriptional LysR family regulator